MADILRLATEADCDALAALIARSARDLQAQDYSAVMQPGADAAQIRAFFVAPDCARQRLGSRLLAACEEAALAAGFQHAEMVATLAGERLYLRHGWVSEKRYDAILPGGKALPVIRMTKWLQGPCGQY